MADTKISAMTAAALPLTGVELVPIVQGGINKKTTVADLDAYNRSYGSWSDSTDQPGSTIAGTVMTYNTADVTNGVTLVGGSQITVPNTGIFDLQFSSQFVNTDNAQHEVWIWARVNGVDVPNSATIVTVPARKNSNIFGYAVAAWNLFFTLNSNDYIELVWLKSSATVTMESLPATVSPVIPAIPSVIVSVQQVA
jgi:hypothetical protein